MQGLTQRELLNLCQDEMRSGASALVKALEDAPMALRGVHDPNMVAMVMAKAMRCVEDRTADAPEDVLATQTAPAHHMLDALCEVASKLGMDCLTHSRLQLVVAEVQRHRHELTECLAIEAIRAVKDAVLKAILRWEEEAYNKAMSYNMDNKFKAYTAPGAGGPASPKRRRLTPQGEAADITPAGRIAARELGEKLEPGSSVCYRWASINKRCVKGCTRLPCNGRAGPDFYRLARDTNRRSG